MIVIHVKFLIVNKGDKVFVINVSLKLLFSSINLSLWFSYQLDVAKRS